MTLPLASGYISNLARTEAEVQQALEDIASVERESIGGRAESAVVILAGVATIDGTCATIDTEAAAATDNLDNIAQPATQQDGKVVIIRPASAARVVTVRHDQGGTGEILLADERPAILNDPTKRIILQRVGTAWREIGRHFVDEHLREVKNVTTTYPVVVADNGKLITADATAGAFDVDLPAAATVGNGFKITIKKTDASANAVTIDPNGAETIDGASTFVLDAQNETAIIVSNGTQWFIASSSASTSSGDTFNVKTFDDATRATSVVTAGIEFQIPLSTSYSYTKQSSTSIIVVHYEITIFSIEIKYCAVDLGGTKRGYGGFHDPTAVVGTVSGTDARSGESAGAKTYTFHAKPTGSGTFVVNPNSSDDASIAHQSRSVVTIYEVEP